MARALPDETDERVAQLREAVRYVSQFEFYRAKLDEAGLDPDDVDSFETFRQIPPMDARDLATDVAENPPFGSLVSDERDLVRCNFTPNPHLDTRMPVVATADEIQTRRERLAAEYRAVGVTEDDVVLNTASTTPYPFGWSVAGAAEEIGALHIPMGPGDTEEQVRVIENHGVTTVCGFPSFALKIAQAADGPLDSVDQVLAGGEPFTAIEGYREEVRDAFGGDVTVVDGYGLSEVGGVARESHLEDGMHVNTDALFPEVIDPETGELVERGEKGELVLTHLTERSVPVVRFRTHDVTILEKRPTEYGEYVLPEGVFGRSDSMVKAKGVKVYPDEVFLYLAGVDAVDQSNARLAVSRPDGTTHRVTLTLAGDPATVDVDALRSEIESRINIRLDGFALEPDFEIGEDESRVVTSH